MTTRRTFLKASSLAALATTGRPHHHLMRRAPSLELPAGENPRATDPQLKVLAQRALDAATAAGASYADVRFTTTHWRTFQEATPPTDRNLLAVGVRALAKGAWGFAAHSLCTADLVAYLGQKAAEHAKAVAWSHVPPIELIDDPSAAVGSWITPIKRDPFTVSPEEVATWMRAIKAKGGSVRALTFEKQERTFASTAGAYTTQTVYTSLGNVPRQAVLPSQISVEDANGNQYNCPLVMPTGAGYEVLDDVLAYIPEWLEAIGGLGRAKPFGTFGEYEVVFDGAAMAAIVQGTFGIPLEYDRAVGYEANAGGTSYLAPPLKVLGTEHAPAAVTILGNRTLARGCATVGWDDEGVAPSPFPLVNNGVVVDYASSREFVAELAPWYRRHGVPVQSNGCVASENALTVPLVYAPNLVLQPAAQDTSLDALLNGVDDGLLVCGGDLRMDMQQLSGVGGGQGVQVYAIKHGKRAEGIQDAVYTFHTQELWKSLAALGGASTAMLRGLYMAKGQPTQVTAHSVQAVAAHFRKVQVYNSTSV